MLESKNANQMIVEGADDRASVIHLMKAHVDWPKGKEAAPVFINMGGGVLEILKPDLLGLYLKSSVITKFGIMLDADSKIVGRYEAIRKICVGFFPALPTTLPAEGVVVDNNENKRLGIWLMPDNSTEGALETFLKHLIPSDAEATWEFAKQSAQSAREMGCSYKDADIDRANLCTWLAWQDEPGVSPGIAITKRILDPSNPIATPFVEWFRKLYDLPPKTQLF